MNFFSVGIDIGGTNIAWGIVDDKGNILNKYSWPTQSYTDITTLCIDIKKTLDDLGILQFIKGIGIGTPAADAELGIINNSSNLPWKGIVPIVELFAQHFTTPIFIDNDARAAAWGEKVYGAAQAITDYAYVTLGTGVGCGIVLNNKILIGAHKYAGEIGHIILKKDGRTCGCGRNGCLETYVSTSGIAETYNELSNDKKVKNSLEVYQLYQSGDLIAKETFLLTAEYLSMGLSQLITILGIENIFLFGGPTQAHDAFIEPLRTFTHDNSLHLFNKKIKINISKVDSHNVAILGAAALVHRH